MRISKFKLLKKPYYKENKNEVALFKAAFQKKIPMMLKGPTGCGKTRFVEHMAWKLKRPLITISCHEDMTASDLIGRYLLDANGTKWHDGPLTTAVRYGAICYLDEIVEARQDTNVVIHSLTDDRRILSLEKCNEILTAHPEFQLVISYNPGYQSVLKDLKESTKQRFGALELRYPNEAFEAQIVAHESTLPIEIATKLVKISSQTRNLKGAGLNEGASTRMLIRAGELIMSGVNFLEACEVAILTPLTDDPDARAALTKIISTYSL
jgi:nitric oxide reductase NorQ protein